MEQFLKKSDPYIYRIFTTLFRLLRIFIQRYQYENKILILRPGGMGDLICVTIALKQCQIDLSNFVFLIQKRSEPWAKHLRLKYILIGFNKSFFTNIFRFQFVINTEQLFGTSTALAILFSRLNGLITGFLTCRGSRSYNLAVEYESENQQHEVLNFKNLFIKSLHQVTNDLITYHSYLEDPPPLLNKIVIGIAGLQAPSRTLLVSEWLEIIDKITENQALIFISAPVDESFIKRLFEFRGPRDWQHFIGDFSMVVEKIRRASLLVTVDGGLVHVASYYGVPTAAVFTSGQDKKWAPLGKGSYIIKNTSISCSPCTRFGQVPPCPHRFQCKKDLKVLL